MDGKKQLMKLLASGCVKIPRQEWYYCAQSLFRLLFFLYMRISRFVAVAAAAAVAVGLFILQYTLSTNPMSYDV